MVVLFLLVAVLFVLFIYYYFQEKRNRERLTRENERLQSKVQEQETLLRNLQDGMQNANALIDYLKNGSNDQFVSRASYDEEVESLTEEIEELTEQLDAYEIEKEKATQRRQEYKKQKKKEEELLEDIRTNPHKYFQFKPYFMNLSEVWAYHYICKALCDIFGTVSGKPVPDDFVHNDRKINPFCFLENQKHLFVFPQTAVYSFTANNDQTQNEKQLREYANRVLGGKSVDFIICKRTYVHGYDVNFGFKPVLAIELDGITHNPGTVTEQQKKNDEFKDLLMSQHDDEQPVKDLVPLMRYKLTTPMSKDGKFFYTYNDEDKEKIKEMLRKYLCHV